MAAQFWEWLIRDVQARYPDVIFLARRSRDRGSWSISVEGVAQLKREGYVPINACNDNDQLRTALEQIARGDFSPGDPHRFEPIVNSLINRGDGFMVLVDFADNGRAQPGVDALWSDPEAWVQRAINSVANMGRFSADRSSDEYADHVWRCRVGG